MKSSPPPFNPFPSSHVPTKTHEASFWPQLASIPQSAYTQQELFHSCTHPPPHMMNMTLVSSTPRCGCQVICPTSNISPSQTQSTVAAHSLQQATKHVCPPLEQKAMLCFTHHSCLMQHIPLTVTVAEVAATITKELASQQITTSITEWVTANDESGSVFATLTQEDLIYLGVSSLGAHCLILNLKLS